MDFRNHIQFCMTYLILHIVAGTKNSPVVTTSDGQLRGIEVRTRDGRPYFAFVGVPYSRVTARFEVRLFGLESLRKTQWVKDEFSNKSILKNCISQRNQTFRGQEFVMRPSLARFAPNFLLDQLL